MWGVSMFQKSARKRFGYYAIKKGFITEDQLNEAMKIQISSELNGGDPDFIGKIMKKMGFMTDKQVEEVIIDSFKLERYKCPNCGILIHECPNCRTDLMGFGR